MSIKNANRWGRAGAEPYVVGMLGFLLALAIRIVLTPVLNDHLPMLFFAANCVVIGFKYGFMPSFFLLLISLPAALYFFTKPFYSFEILDETDVHILIIYSSLVVLSNLLFELLRREQYKSSLLARVSETRYRLLVEADEDRRAALKSVWNSAPKS